VAGTPVPSFPLHQNGIETENYDREQGGIAPFPCIRMELKPLKEPYSYIRSYLSLASEWN